MSCNCNLPPEEILAELYAAVLKFADATPQLDDLTAVVIRRTAAATSQNVAQSQTAAA